MRIRCFLPLILAVALLLFGREAAAQCTPPVNSINCQPAAVSLQRSDLGLTYQNSLSPHTRQMPWSAVLALIDASDLATALGYVPVQSATLTGDASGTSSSGPGLSIATTVSKIGGVSISLAGAFTTSGAFPVTLTATGSTTVTLPTSGLLAAQSGAFTNGHCVSYTGGFLVDAGAACGSGSGTVTTVSVASANGFAGTVANATTTPAITISTSITGALKGNGTAVSQAACADLSNAATSCSIDATSKVCVVSWDSNTTVAAGTSPCFVPPFAGTINSVSYFTNGSSTPSFTVNVRIAGTGVTSCSALSVSSGSVTTTSCTALNTFTAGQIVDVVTSSVNGTPNQAVVQINFHQTGS